MSKAMHTPGPWTIAHDTDISGSENDPANGCVGPVDVAHVYLRTVPARTEANARLIAAAPDLLTAAQEARKALSELLMTRDPIVYERALSLLDRAISKATTRGS